MKFILNILYAVIVFVILTSYNILSTLILCLIPRTLRRKKDIKGQRVLITGAGSGIGRALAIEFSKHATSLILVDINKQSLFQTEKLLDRCSLVFIYDCDVSDYKKVYEMANRVQKDAGDVDILVNNAGTVCGKFLWDLPEEKIVKTMEVNTLAHFWMCKAFLPAMMKKNRGHIVSVISLSGKTGAPRLSDYSASKFAAMGLVESLQMELRIKKMDGIKITAICPAIVDTILFKGAHLRAVSPISPAYVAKETVAAVLENEEIIFVPRYFKILMMIKELSPHWLMIIGYEILGIINVMDDFVGGEQLENGTDVKDQDKKRD